MQCKPLIVIGGGGHTHVVLAIAQAAGLIVRGIVTNNAQLLGTTVFGVPVLGLEENNFLNPDEVTLVNGVGNHASNEGSGMGPRRALYARYRAAGFDFPTLVSPQALVQLHVVVGQGAQIMPGAVVQPGAEIGENAIINTGAVVDHDVRLAAHCHVAPGAVLCGGVSVGEEAHIGAGAVVIQQVRIGRGAVIGAGAVVTRDVADGAVIFSK